MPFYDQTVEQVLAWLKVPSHGLSTAEAAQRLAQHGPNRLPEAPPKPAWRRLLNQFDNVLVHILLAAGFVTAWLGETVDSSVIFGVIAVNALVGFVQEGKAESALRSIMQMVQIQTHVWRDGNLHTVEAATLVPGDVVLLQSGDRVPADVRLFQTRELRCDESALTGESEPVSKSAVPVPLDAPLAERSSMAYLGTMVTVGASHGVVVATGADTELGKIGTLVGSVTIPETPLSIQLGRFGRVLAVMTLIVTALTVLVGVTVQNLDLITVFKAAVGMAVAAIPEGLPAIVTITLAIGVQRMARNRALVRHLPAVEVLGSVTVICTDKTGTLTRNEMTVESFQQNGQHYRVTGEGYAPNGDIFDLHEQCVSVENDAAIALAARIAMLCNTASLNQHGDDWQVSGDPTEGALLSFARKAGLNSEELNAQWPRIDLIPFESERGYMATLNHDHEGHTELLIKGSPERLLQACDTAWTADGAVALDHATWQHRIQQLADQGLRTLALAFRAMPAGTSAAAHADAETGLCLLGVIGMADPPREEAKTAIQQCREAGIRVKMITGDHPRTATAIARLLGLNADSALTGQQIAASTDAELALQVAQTDVFARASPADKLRIIDALHQQGHVLAMTGDGVNDAPALRRANIGIAMGHKGTDAAREASDIVLTDDNFATLADAVREGRTVYDNIIKSMIFIMPTGIAEAAVILLAVVSGLAMPITPPQILWVNMITAVSLSLAIAFEPPERNIMQRPPRPPAQGIFTPTLLRRMLLVSVLGTTMAFSLVLWLQHAGESLETTRTVVVNALVMFEAFYLLNARSLMPVWHQTTGRWGGAPIWMAIALVLALQLSFTYAPPMQRVFHSQPLSMPHWGMIIVAAGLVFVLVEIEKWFSHHPQRARPAL